MAATDILMLVCAHVDTVQQLALLSRTNKALKEYLSSDEGGRIWLNVAKQTCGEEFWNEACHVKNGRYEAMVRLCPWLGERSEEPLTKYPRTSHLFNRMDDRLDNLKKSERIALVMDDVSEYVACLVARSEFKKRIACDLPGTDNFVVKDVQIVHIGLVASHMIQGNCGYVFFWATAGFRLLKIMSYVRGCLSFSCGGMSFLSSRPTAIVHYASSDSRTVPVLQDRTERLFSVMSIALNEIDTNGESAYKKFSGFEITWRFCMERYWDFPTWKIVSWPGIKVYFEERVLKEKEEDGELMKFELAMPDDVEASTLSAAVVELRAGNFFYG
jgi:hypothetical protein